MLQIASAGKEYGDATISGISMRGQVGLSHPDALLDQHDVARVVGAREIFDGNEITRFQVGKRDVQLAAHRQWRRFCSVIAS